MLGIRIPHPWQRETHVTPEEIFFSRRRFLTQLGSAGAGASFSTSFSIFGFGGREAAPSVERDLSGIPLNPTFSNPERPLTEEIVAARHNNFYEFGSGKRIWRGAQALPTDPWTVEITGMVQQPQQLGLEDLFNFPLEERIYRFRCVEAWAMVVPWLGFPMRLLLERVDPLPSAKFVRLTSFYDRDIMYGPIWPPNLPWPYTEGLRIEEMANELAFFALGIYGKPLPKQHGAPIRMVLPWKYGFKGGKSIVKIEFLARQPSTFWNTVAPDEYGFEANVDPTVPHPRWSQEQETLIGFGSRSQWQTVPTLPYNGYGEYVAHLYA